MADGGASSRQVPTRSSFSHEIATFNVNGITARACLEWLARRARRRLPAGAETSDETFPAAALLALGTARRGTARKIQRRRGARAARPRRASTRPARRPDDTLPLPRSDDARPGRRVDLPANGNPQPARSSTTSWRGSIAWPSMRQLVGGAQPVVLAGDYSIVATDEGRRHIRRAPTSTTRCCSRRRGHLWRLLEKGWTGSIQHAPWKAPLHILGLLRNRFPRDAGLRIDHLLLNARVAAPRIGRVDRLCARVTSRATTRRPESRCATGDCAFR